MSRKRKLLDIETVESYGRRIKKRKLSPLSLVKCPICNRLVDNGFINLHLDSDCSGMESDNTKCDATNGPKYRMAECPKCGVAVLRGGINMHLDLDCEMVRNKVVAIKKGSDIRKYETALPGLYLHRDFVTEEESDRLLQEIKGYPWSRNRDVGLRGKRRSQHYGPELDEMYRVKTGSKDFTKLPPLAHQIGQRISDFWNSCSGVSSGSLRNKMSSLKSNDFNELLVNEYQAHDELLFHFDQRGAFEELLCGLSLVSHSTMSFQHGTNDYDVIKMALPPRSVYFMSGKARYVYKHGFIKNDIRGYRISLTYRTVRMIFGPKNTAKQMSKQNKLAFNVAKKS